MFRGGEWSRCVQLGVGEMEVECTGTTDWWFFIVMCVGVRESVRRPCAAAPPPAMRPPKTSAQSKVAQGK